MSCPRRGKQIRAANGWPLLPAPYMRRWKARAVAVWAEVKDVEVALGNGAVSSDDYCTIIKDCAENLEEMEQFTGLCLCRQCASTPYFCSR